FLRFSTVGHFTNCQTANPHAFWSNGLSDGIPDTAGNVMVFDGNDGVVSGSRSFQQCCSIDRANAEQINHANRDPLPLQLVICFQGFCERDASAYNGDDILIALTKHFRSPNFELLVISVDDGLLRTSGADVG